MAGYAAAVDDKLVSEAVLACFRADVEKLNTILTKHPDVANGHDEAFNDSTPLHVAFGEGESECVLALLAAGAWAENGGNDAAAEALRNAAGDNAGDSVLGDLADLKLVMMAGQDMDPAIRDQILSRLSRAGAPFELLALEQKAVALIEAGRNDDAITLIRQIQAKNGLSEALRRRLSEMMIALGVEPQPAETMPNEAMPTETMPNAG